MDGSGGCAFTWTGRQVAVGGEQRNGTFCSCYLDLSRPCQQGMASAGDTGGRKQLAGAARQHRKPTATKASELTVSQRERTLTRDATHWATSATSIQPR